MLLSGSLRSLSFFRRSRKNARRTFFLSLRRLVTQVERPSVLFFFSGQAHGLLKWRIFPLRVSDVALSNHGPGFSKIRYPLYTFRRSNTAPDRYEFCC